MSTVLADIFLSQDAREVLKNKFVIMIGDSVIRSMYKDLVKLLQTNEHLTDKQLKNKGEYYFENDELTEGGKKGIMSNDVSYTEVREYKSEFHLVRFYFITRCYSDYLMSICEDISKDKEKPNVCIMNSGCWDITRYGPNSIYEYKQNLPMGIFQLIKVLSSYTVFIWTTTLPLSRDVKGGFMIPEVEGTKSKLREDVLEANMYAVKVMREFKLDVIDLHHYFLKHIQRRAKDGIHWDATAHRRISNLILNRLCEVWDIDTPGRILVKRDPKIIEPSNNTDDYELLYEQDNFNENGYNNYDGYDSYENFDTNPLPDELMNRINDIKKNSNYNNFNPNAYESEASNDYDYNNNVTNNCKRSKTTHVFKNNDNIVNNQTSNPNMQALLPNPPLNHMPLIQTLYYEQQQHQLKQIKQIILYQQIQQQYTPQPVQLLQPAIMPAVPQQAIMPLMSLDPNTNKRKFSG